VAPEYFHDAPERLDVIGFMSYLAGAAPPVLALSDDQSARTLFVAEQGPID
jgi:hypothetical protein